MNNEVSKSTRMVIIEKYTNSDCERLLLYRQMLTNCIDNDDKYGIERYKLLLKERLKKIILKNYKLYR